MAKINLTGNYKIQSGWLDLKASGSDGSDGSVEGRHLRWALRRNLGDDHLPKGQLAAPGSPYEPLVPQAQGFNRSDDYFFLYRAPFQVTFDTYFSLASPPSSIVSTGPTREIHYSNLAVNQLATETTDVYLKFNNISQFDTLIANPMYDPAIIGDCQPLMAAYTSIVELHTVDKLMMGYSMDPNPGTTGQELKLETVSLPDTQETSQKSVICRKTYNLPSNPLTTTFEYGENIDHLRFAYKGEYFPVRIRVMTYEDQLRGYNDQNAWTQIDSFALEYDASNDQKVLDRLEGPSFTLTWPKFDTTNGSGGEFMLNPTNYVDRWNPNINGNTSFDFSESLKQGVLDYLVQSQTTLGGEISLPSESTNIRPNLTHHDTKMIDLLRMASLDYHAARMLGLGHIDTHFDNNPNDPYIYIGTYKTLAELDDGNSPVTVDHFYMTMPTSTENYRLPPQPDISQIFYGLQSNNGTSTPTQLTNPGGYSKFSKARYIQFFRSQFKYEKEFEDFYETSEFCDKQMSLPIMLGVRYKKDGESIYRKPELTSDDRFKDASGNLDETVPLPINGHLNKPVFIHEETEDGIHDYAFYSINWFSRTSALGTAVQTDATDFSSSNPNYKPVQNIIPPLNFSTQLIQKESPLLFTTQIEQDLLENLAGPDKTLVRATFNWNHVNVRSYQFATCVEFFFRELSPPSVKGKVAGITDLGGGEFQLSTTSYPIESKSPAVTITPSISTAAPFIGSQIFVGGRPYQILDITSTGNNPDIVIKAVKETSSYELKNGYYSTAEKFITPKIDDRFTVLENIKAPSNWDSQLARKVFIEPFFTSRYATISGVGSGDNGEYNVLSVTWNGSHSEVHVAEGFDANGIAPGGSKLAYTRLVRINSVQGSDTLVVAGNIVADLSGVTGVEVIGLTDNDGSYTLAGATLNGSETEVEISGGTVGTSAYYGYLRLVTEIALHSSTSVDNIWKVATDITEKLIPPYREDFTENDGATKNIILGGISDSANVVEYLDKYGPDNLPNPNPNNYAPGDDIPGSTTGVFEITFDNYQLPNHIDPEVMWDKGTLRISEDPSFIPPSPDPAYRLPRKRVLAIWKIDTSGATLKVIASDATHEVDSFYVPTGNYTPIMAGLSLDVNLHPSYRLYLASDTTSGNNFEESTILPSSGLSKKTFMAVRAGDCEQGKHSYISSPSVLMSMDVPDPLPPGEPLGPEFATRPDYYGRSTYTFDMSVDTSGGRKPYWVVIFRGDQYKVLSNLYKKSTMDQILADLDNLTGEDAAYFRDRWKDLFNLNLDGVDFEQYVTDGFRFPYPDNDDFLLPNQDFSAPLQYPFNGSTAPGDMLSAVKAAIDGSFVPLTKDPILYSDLQSGMQTSREDFVLTHNSGQTVRLTDYTIDGSSNSIWFYYGKEIAANLKQSERGPIAGPVKLLRTNAPKTPEVKKIYNRVGDGISEPASVLAFELNEFNASDNVAKISLFRSDNIVDTKSVRTMTLIKSIEINSLSLYSEIIDDFNEFEFKPYTEPMYYRFVAHRRIQNEHYQEEEVASVPSRVLMGTLFDNTRPPDPVVEYVSDPSTTSSPISLPNVKVQWNKTVHNGKYHLYKMDSNGNWVKIHEVVTNNAQIQVALNTTSFGTSNLVKQDSSGATLYYHFKVRSENSSGLSNSNEAKLTI